MYQALYRKYRPVDFDSVVGQDAIIKTLKNSVLNNSFSHAYMFFGPRGTGKTTVSKIFARNINCLEAKDGEACGKCEACKTSFSKECVDIIEIDAASNNGVDEIRELRNKITLVPSVLKYKVYIIDEVHMLSIGAFNALLKTLEEPPEHAIFILATTDPQKVPETVVSRCQCFAFSRISTEIIKKKLKEVCKKEKISIDDEVLDNIAILSEGGLRDALGMLDKLSSYTSEKITNEDFVEVNGIISNVELKKLLDAIFNNEVEKVLKSINEFDKAGKNLIQVVNQLLNYSRNCIVNYYLNDEQYDWPMEKLQDFTSLLNEKIFDIRKSGSSKIFIEMFILKFINDYISSNKTKKTTNVVLEEKKVDNSKEKEIKEEPKEEVKTKKTIKKTNKKLLNIDEIFKVRINNVLAGADKKEKEVEEANLEKLNDYTFDPKIGYIACNLLDSKVRVASKDLVLISFEYDSILEKNKEILEKTEEVYKKITDSNKKLVMISDKTWKKVKDEYIKNLKEKKEYELQEEPKPVYEETKKDDIIGGDALDLFGDIVEIEE